MDERTRRIYELEKISAKVALYAAEMLGDATPAEISQVLTDALHYFDHVKIRVQDHQDCIRRIASEKMQAWYEIENQTRQDPLAL